MKSKDNEYAFKSSFDAHGDSSENRWSERYLKVYVIATKEKHFKISDENKT